MVKMGGLKILVNDQFWGVNKELPHLSKHLIY